MRPNKGLHGRGLPKNLPKISTERICKNCRWWKGRDIHYRRCLTGDVIKRICQRFPKWEHTTEAHSCGEFEEKK